MPSEKPPKPSDFLPKPNIQMTVLSQFHFRKAVKTFKELKERRTIRQRYDYSCGAAALSTILHHYYKLPVSEASVAAFIIKKRGVEEALRRYKEKKGFSLLDLKIAAKAASFRSLAYRDMTLSDLLELNCPVIVPIRTREYDHFVVFRGVEGDRVYLADPIIGNITMKGSNFVDVWHEGIGMALNSENGLVASDWRPNKNEQGFYVTQDMLRTMTARSIASFVARGAGEF